MKIRLHGMPAEVEEAVKRLHGIFTVVSVSDPYPDRRASRSGPRLRENPAVKPLSAPVGLAGA